MHFYLMDYAYKSQPMVSFHFELLASGDRNKTFKSIFQVPNYRNECGMCIGCVILHQLLTLLFVIHSVVPI